MVPAKQQDEGYVIVVVAALIAILLAFAAFAVDFGILYGARTSLQRAADAAALAGASTFILEPNAAQPATADEYARRTVVQNSVFGNFIQSSDISNVIVDTALRRVTVDLTRAENTYFAKAMGWFGATISVQAIAEASAAARSTGCAKPWFVPNTILSSLNPCDAQAAGQIMFTSTGFASPWAKALVQGGHQFTIKPGNPSNAAGPGQFYAIRLGDSSGGMDYRTNIATCTPQGLTCWSSYGVEPGNMIGPTKQGVNDLVTIFQSSPDPTDLWLGPFQYKHPDGTTGDTSHQLVIMPVWDVGDSNNIDCTVGSSTYGRLKGGATVLIKVVGFATVFIQGLGGSPKFTCEPYITSCGPNDVVGRLVDLAGCGEPTQINVTETGPFSLPLRLIRTQ